jgi:CheY-like chemotaxis protein
MKLFESFGVVGGRHSQNISAILLAEDDDSNRKAELLMLEHLGYQADLAVNGLEVLRVLKRKPTI